MCDIQSKRKLRNQEAHTHPEEDLFAIISFKLNTFQMLMSMHINMGMDLAVVVMVVAVREVEHDFDESHNLENMCSVHFNRLLKNELCTNFEH